MPTDVPNPQNSNSPGGLPDWLTGTAMGDLPMPPATDLGMTDPDQGLPSADADPFPSDSFPTFAADRPLDDLLPESYPDLSAAFASPDSLPDLSSSLDRPDSLPDLAGTFAPSESLPDLPSFDALTPLPGLSAFGSNHEPEPPPLSELARLPNAPDFGPPQARPKPQPSVSDTPPPRSAPPLLQADDRLGDDWVTESLRITPVLEDNDNLIAFRVIVRAPVDRGYLNCRVRFPLPQGVKQVHASRKPVARRGYLTWELGPLPPADAISLSVKFQRAANTEFALTNPPAFELSYIAAPTAARLELDANGPEVVRPREEFLLRVVVTNAGDLPADGVVVRLNDPAVAEVTATATLDAIPTLAPGERRVVEFPLTVPMAGRAEWTIAAAVPGTKPVSCVWGTEAIVPTVSLTLHHYQTARVDAEFDLQIDVANVARIRADGVVVAFDVPEELAFVSATAGGRFDGAKSQVTWRIGHLSLADERSVTLRLRGFAAGLARLKATADVADGNPTTTASILSCEIDDRSGQTTLDRILTSQVNLFADDIDHPTIAPVVEGDRHLLFESAGTGYIVAIAGVREVIRPPAITPVPFAPDWLLGVANVRGDVVSVIDLARFLGVEEEAGPRRGMLVAQTSDGSNVVGLLVDEVTGIRRVPASAVGPADDLGDNPVTAYLAGVATLNDRMVPLLDLDKVLMSSALNVFEAA